MYISLQKKWYLHWSR